MQMNGIHFKAFTIFLLDLEEVLERAFETYEIHVSDEQIHIKPGKIKEERVPAKK